MRFVLSRIAQALMTLLVVSFALFVILRSVPGDPARILAGPDAPIEQVEAIRKANGLDRPVPAQYLTWLGNVATGDFGTSVQYSRPVSTLAIDALRPTLELVAMSMSIALLIGIPLGVLAATRARKPTDVIISAVGALTLGFPTFWLGLLALMVFSVRLKWLPASGYVSYFSEPVAGLKSTLMPAAALGLVQGMTIARFVRSAMLEALTGDYVRTAKAKGASGRRVIWRHAFPNALIPTMTIIGLQLGFLIGGTVVVERVFTRPGIGMLLIGGIQTRDYPLVQGIVLLAVFWFALVNLLVELSYGIIDPRIRR